MRPRLTSLFCSTALLSIPLPLLAQAAPPPVEDREPSGGGGVAEPESGNDIIVTGARPSGAVISAVPPDQVLNPQDIASYGAANIGELVGQLSAQTRSGRGRGAGAPVVLVNGRRVSGFNEIRNIPPEAIARVEIFPEEVALDYGFPPDQRVINFILRDRFQSQRGDVEIGGATDGGRATRGLELYYTRIAGRARINASAEYNHATPLTEDERGIVSAPQTIPLSVGGAITNPAGGAISPTLPATIAGVPAGGGSVAAFAAAPVPASVDQTPLRTLLGGRDTLTFDVTVATPFGTRGDGGSFNLRYDRATGRTLQGLAGASVLVPTGTPGSPFGQPVLLTRLYDTANPLVGTTTSDTFHAGASTDGRVGKWRWNLTGNLDSALTNASNDRGIDVAALQAAINAGANPFVSDTTTLAVRRDPDLARQLTQSGDANLVLNGPLFTLPAGAVRLTVQGGYGRQMIDSSATRAGVVTLTDLSRDQWNGSANVDVPILDRDRQAIPVLGSISANGRYAWQRVSGFGDLTDYTVGINWQPVQRLSLISTWVGDEGAPTLVQLGAPALITPAVPIYDFTRGQTVLANSITGGNPNLRAEAKRDYRFSATWQPIPDTDLTLTATYARTLSTNTTAGFPILTPEIEAAFPGRVTRDVTGAITSVDQRSVNFAQTRGRQIRYGVAYARSFGTPAPGSGGMFGIPGGGGRGGGSRGGPPGAGAPGGGAGGPGAGVGGPPRGPGGGGFGGFGGGRGPGGGGGRWNVAAYHTIQLQDDILIAPGIPRLDLLNGSATGSTGGSPRHGVEFDGGWFYRGIGIRGNGTWRDGTRVNGSTTGAASASTLRFSPLMQINLRAFVDMDQRTSWVRAVPLLRHSRLLIRVDNIFNDRQEVRDASGAVPLRYQPGYIDPAGRTIVVDFSKRF